MFSTHNPTHEQSLLPTFAFCWYSCDKNENILKTRQHFLHIIHDIFQRKKENKEKRVTSTTHRRIVCLRHHRLINLAMTLTFDLGP